MSDNHGRYQHIIDVREMEEGADWYFHCGDSEGYDEDLNNWEAVCGNCDYWSDLPDRIRIKIEDKQIMIMHGNQFGYFDREQRMLNYMEEEELDILVTGHTHRPMFIEYEGKYLINPGSTAEPRTEERIPTYCVLTIDGDLVDVEFKVFKPIERQEEE